MTKKTEQPDIAKSDQPLAGMQKLFFGLVCWGVESWSKAKNFKTNGYTQKYVDARNAMHTGLAIYGAIITVLILALLFS